MLIPLVVLMHLCVVPASSNQLGAGNVFSFELDWGHKVLAREKSFLLRNQDSFQMCLP